MKGVGVMQRPRVFVTRRLPGEALERLAAQVDLAVWPETGAPPPEALANALRGAQVGRVAIKRSW